MTPATAIVVITFRSSVSPRSSLVAACAADSLTAVVVLSPLRATYRSTPAGHLP